MFRTLCMCSVSTCVTTHITLCRSITMIYGIDNIPSNIPQYPYIYIECGKHLRIFHEIWSLPHNTLMDLNNVMHEFGLIMLCWKFILGTWSFPETLQEEEWKHLETLWAHEMVIIAIRIIHKWVERLQVSLVGINHAQIYRECDESRFFFLMSRICGTWYVCHLL